MTSTGYARRFGSPPEIRSEAPGRVNLIGEHTDYNGGFVLPVATPQRTRVQLTPRSDAVVRVASAQADGGRVAEFSLGNEAPGRGWLDYVQGVTSVLSAGGHRIGGFEAWIESDLPLGAGLASSAALEVALLRGLREAFGLSLPDVELAQLGQRAENDFVGARVGIMDQLAASLAEVDRALFVDTRALSFRSIALPPDGELVVIASGVTHDHALGEYNTRRAECERAATLLAVTELRDIGVADLDRVHALPEPLNRRARHVVTENARVVEAVAALERRDLARVGELFNASHTSMRDDYEVSTPEVDLLVELVGSRPGVFGARLTGGGFGGAIVALIRRGFGHDAASGAVADFSSRTGRAARILIPAPS